MVGATYIANAEKARRELGWQLRPIREGMEEVFDYIARNTIVHSPETIRTRHTLGLIAAIVLGLGGWQALVRRRKR